MSFLRDHLEQSIRKRRLFRQGQSILVAVSGGVDSMVLLHALHALSARHGWRLAVAHLNHQLRGRSSDADERLVRHATGRLKLKLVTGWADVRKLARAEKLSIEMAGRQARHAFLARAARQVRARTIALAHHADDQLETFFIRLLRGSGGEGLGGMKWRSPSPAGARFELVRPLLDLPKSALRQNAAEERIRFREDASNESVEVERNRIRHELLPLIEKRFQPALARTILRAMDLVGAEAEFVTDAAREWLERGRVRPLPLARRSSPVPFEGLALAVQRRVLQLQLVSLGVSPDFDLVEQLRTGCNRPASAGRTPFAGSRDGNRLAACPRYVSRDNRGFLHLHVAGRAGFTAASIEVELKGRAGVVTFEGARIRWRLSRRLVRAMPRRKAGGEVFDAEKVGAQVVLRHWQPGDRFQPIGMPGPVKLQDLFTNQKVPRARRHELTVGATAAGEIFWVEGLRIAERFKLTESTIYGLHWRWERV